MNLYEIRKHLETGGSVYDLKLRVTFYTRVSTDHLQQLNSLRNQISYFTEYINGQKNWVLVEGYIDEGITGTCTKKRERFLKMVEDAVVHKKFDLIITKEVSRFARNTVDSLVYTRKLIEAGVGVLFLSDSINTLIADSELRLAIMSSLAQEESRKISDRVKFGHRRSVEDGRVLGNNRIIGYKKDDGKLVVDNDRAIIVKKIFDMYCDGLGFRTISKELNCIGVVSASGSAFGYSTLKSIITNPKYKGYYVGGKSTTLDYISKKRINHSREDWIMYKAKDDIVPAIVNEKTWEKANAILAERSKKMHSSNPTSYQNKYAYSGKIFCKKHNETYWRNLIKYDNISSELWQCRVYRKDGRKGCANPHIYKWELDYIVSMVIKKTIFNNPQVINDLLRIYTKVNTKDKSNCGVLNAKKLENCIDSMLIEEFTSKNRLNVKLDFEELIELLLDRVEIEEAVTDDILHIRIVLKTRNTADIVYIRRNKTENDVRLLFSRHMIRADIETEIAPLVGSERQSEELLKYMMEEFEMDTTKLWNSNIFGKSLHELVGEGLNNKLSKMPDEARLKLKETLQRIINEGSTGLVCIIL